METEIADWIADNQNLVARLWNDKRGRLDRVIPQAELESINGNGKTTQIGRKTSQAKKVGKDLRDGAGRNNFAIANGTADASSFAVTGSI